MNTYITKALSILHDARVLSVKEPMQLSDRMKLNGMIREAIQNIDNYKESTEEK